MLVEAPAGRTGTGASPRSHRRQP